MFLAEISSEYSEAGGKASGYLNILQKFESLFLIRTQISNSERDEQQNLIMQKKSLR
jgi:hypothetical protein